MLSRYNEIQKQIEVLQAEAKEIESAIRAEVEKTGDMIAGHGWVARMKIGGKSTNHEAAAHAQIAPALFRDLYEPLLQQK